MFNYYSGNYISMTGQKETSSGEAEDKRFDSFGLKYFCI